MPRRRRSKGKRQRQVVGSGYEGPEFSEEYTLEGSFIQRRASRQALFGHVCLWCNTSLKGKRSDAETCSSSCRSQLSRARTNFKNCFKVGVDKDVAWMLNVPINVHHHFACEIIHMYLQIEELFHIPARTAVTETASMLFLQGAQSVESTAEEYQASSGWVTVFLSLNLLHSSLMTKFKEAFNGSQPESIDPSQEPDS